MANNTTVNKVVINNNTVLDLTDTTATSDKVLDGEVFYTASGSRAVGTYVDQDTTDLTQMTGVLPIANGGTGADNSADARINLGISTPRYQTVSVTLNVNTATNVGGKYSGTYSLSNVSTFDNTSAIIPLYARRPGSSYICVAEVENGTLRVQSDVSLESVTVGLLLIY